MNRIECLKVRPEVDVDIGQREQMNQLGTGTGGRTQIARTMQRPYVKPRLYEDQVFILAALDGDYKIKRDLPAAVTCLLCRQVPCCRDLGKSLPEEV